MPAVSCCGPDPGRIPVLSALLHHSRIVVARMVLHHVGHGVGGADVLYNGTTFPWCGSEYSWADLQQALTTLAAPDADRTQLICDYQDPLDAASWRPFNKDCVGLLQLLAHIRNFQVWTGCFATLVQSSDVVHTLDGA